MRGEGSTVRCSSPQQRVENSAAAAIFHAACFGRAAFFRSNGRQYAELIVWTGPHHFTIQFGVPTGGTPESIRPNTITLANAIVAKLR